MTRAQPNEGFTLLECMMALLLLSTSLVILVESQSWAVSSEQRSNRINAATMLAREIMVELELRMEKEGFGELEIRERGDFHDERYRDRFEEYRWEYEVEKVEVELPNMGQLLGLGGDGANAAAEEAGVATGGAEPSNEFAMLEALGVEPSFLTDMLGNYLREARVRVCYPDGSSVDGRPAENCIEVITHLANPTGRVLSEEEQLLLEQQEDATDEAEGR